MIQCSVWISNADSEESGIPWRGSWCLASGEILIDCIEWINFNPNGNVRCYNFVVFAWASCWYSMHATCSERHSQLAQRTNTTSLLIVHPRRANKLDDDLWLVVSANQEMLEQPFTCRLAISAAWKRVSQESSWCTASGETLNCNKHRW